MNNFFGNNLDFVSAIVGLVK